MSLRSIIAKLVGVLTADFSNGNPLPPSGVFADSGAINLNADDGQTLFTSATAITLGSAVIRHPASTTVTLVNSSVNQEVIPVSGSLTIENNQGATDPNNGPIVFVNTSATVLFDGSQFLQTLNILPQGTARMLENGSAILDVDNLQIGDAADMGDTGDNGGVLDLADNALIAHSSDSDALTAAVANGYDGGKWDGEASLGHAAIISSVAAADTTGTEAIGYALVGSDSYSGQISLSNFDGQSVEYDDFVAKFTYYGDANLDGIVDSADFNILAANDGSTLTGWSNGDFNYSGIIDSADQPLLLKNLRLEAPTGLIASSISQNQVELSWTNHSTDTTQVGIYASVNGTDFFPFDAIDSNVSNYVAKGLAPNTTYTFEVAATNTTLAISPPSNTQSVTTDADPWNLQVTGPATAIEGEGYQLNLSINLSASAPVFDHVIVNWGDGTADSTYTLAQLPPPPHVFATGIDSAIIDVVASTASSSAAPYSVTVKPVAIDLIPSAPTLLQTSIDSPTEVDLNWTDNSQDADGYDVLRSLDQGTSYQTIADVGGTDSGYDDTSLTPGQTAEYEVEATGDSAANVSAPAMAAAVTTPITSVDSSTPTLSAQLSPTVPNAALLTYTYAGSDDSGFELEMQDQTTGQNFYLLATPGAVDATGTGTYTVPGLNVGDAYMFRIRADHNGGTASHYVGTSFTLTQADVSVTATPGGNEFGGYYITVNWSASSAAASAHGGVSSYSVQLRGSLFVGNGWSGTDQFGSNFTFDGQTTSFQDDYLGRGQTAQFRVQATYADHTLSAWGYSAMVTEGGSYGFAPSVSAHVASSTEVDLTISDGDPSAGNATAPHNIGGYYSAIYYSISYAPITNSAGEGTPLLLTADQHTRLPNVSEVIAITGLTPGVLYDFSVEGTWHLYGFAGNKWDESGFGITHDYVDPGVPDNAPLAPDKVWAVNLGDGVSTANIELLWHNSSNNEDGFIIQRSDGPNFDLSDDQEFRVGSDSTIYLDSFADKRNYFSTDPNYIVDKDSPTYYRVAAFKGNARSAWVNVDIVPPHSPLAMAISWIEFTPTHWQLDAVDNNTPPASFTETSFSAWKELEDYRNILEVTVGYSVDPYTGKLVTVSPGVHDDVGYTPVPLLSGISGKISNQGDGGGGPTVNPPEFDAGRTQATVVVLARFRVGAVENFFYYASNSIISLDPINTSRLCWAWVRIQYTVYADGSAPTIGFAGSAVPSQSDYIDFSQVGGYSMASDNTNGINRFLFTPYGALGPVDSRGLGGDGD